MKKKNTLLIKGYFEEGCKKNNSLKIMLDQKELNVAIDEEINQGIALSREKILNNVWDYRQSLERVGQNIFMNCKWNCRETGKKDKKSE